MNTLAEEVLAHIFFHLNPRGKISASSTCKNWMKIMNDHPELFDDVPVCFNDSTEEILKIFCNMSRKFCYFRFLKITVHGKCIDFLRKFSLQFRRLSFRCCEINKEYIEMKLCFDNLWELEIYNCKAWLMFVHLPRLKHLRFEIDSEFSEWDMAQIENITPLTMKDLGVSGSQENLERIFPAMKHFICKRRLTLESLDFSKLDINDDLVLGLSEMEDLRLKRLKLSCRFLLVKHISFICNSQKFIVALDFHDISNVQEHAVQAVCMTLPRLEELNLSTCIFDNGSLGLIFQLKRLRKLDLSSCRGICKASFRNALERFACHNLEWLNLSNTRINDVLHHLWPLVPNLRELHLCHCGTDLTLFGISRNLASLRSLDMSQSENITDKGLLGNLEAVPLSNIKGLKELKLRECRLTEEGLTRAIRFEWLMLLDVRGSICLTAAGKEALKKQNPKLTRVDC